MPDMLVKLYELPESTEVFKELENKGYRIIRAMAPNKIKVLDFVRKNFSDYWVSECDVAFSNNPISCIIAVDSNKEIVGFACYETTCKAFFGPIGVKESHRGLNLGKALLLAALQGLKEMGYAYAIIGGAEDAIGFYEKTVNATVIPGSAPGIYKNMLYP
ncbi:MAG: GNAT family N-acetyltransferase [Clostridiaceae bacterium]|nr:GNAT family N-acetyltransferase [Clostridiaceae bacterium]